MKMKLLKWVKKVIKKILKILFKIVKILLSGIIILFACVILLQRFSNSTISFAGYRVFVVVTGSMEPVYGVGDVLLCKSIDLNKLKVDDDVTYLGKEGSFKDRVVTHRIVKIDEKDGKKIFYTKGVANNSIDPPIDGSQIYGRVSRKLVILSLLYHYSSTGIGFLLFVIFPIMILVGSEIVRTMLDKKSTQVNNSQPLNQQNNINNQGVTAEQLQKQLLDLQQQVMQKAQNTSNQVSNNIQLDSPASQPVVQNVNQAVNQTVSSNSTLVNQNNVVQPTNSAVISEATNNQVINQNSINTVQNQDNNINNN